MTKNAIEEQVQKDINELKVAAASLLTLGLIVFCGLLTPTIKAQNWAYSNTRVNELTVGGLGLRLDQTDLGQGRWDSRFSAGIGVALNNYQGVLAVGNNYGPSGNAIAADFDMGANLNLNPQKRTDLHISVSPNGLNVDSDLIK